MAGATSATPAHAHTPFPPAPPYTHACGPCTVADERAQARARPAPSPSTRRQDTPVGRFMHAREEAALRRAAAADAAAGPAENSLAEAGFGFEDQAAAPGPARP